MTNKKTVDELLNEVSYGDDDMYVPSEFAINFVNMIKLIHDGDPENKTPVVHYRMLDNFIKEKDLDTLNMCHRGFAKLERGSNLVLTPTGWVTMRDLKVGDFVFNKEGKRTRINYKTEPMYPKMFKMTLSDGVVIEVGDEHNHEILVRKLNKVTGEREWVTKAVTTQEMFDKGLTYNTVRKSSRDGKAQYRYKIPLVKPIQFVEKSLPVSPYLMGYGIANGSFGKSVIHSHKDDFDEVKGYVEDEGYTWLGVSHTSENGVRGKLDGHVFKTWEGLKSRDKYLPEDYLFGSVRQRWELLRGLMDGDGNIQGNGGCRYSTYSEQLAKDVVDLVRSLGGLAKYAVYVHKDSGSTEYVVTLNVHENPFKLKRKADKWKPTKKMSKSVVGLEEVELEEEGYCIQVDSDCHTYVTSGYTVTHNTTVKMYLLFYIALFNELPEFGSVPYALYISDSMDNGVKKMRNRIEDTWNDSPFLQQMLPKEGMKITDPRWEFRNADGKRFVVTGHGAQQKIRGTVENSSRPVLALLDDLISDEDARSDTAIRNIEATIYNAIEFALHPTRKKVIWSGTPFNARDPLYKAIESGAWAVNLYPVCEKFPCTKEEFRGSWEDRFTYESVYKKYVKMKESGKLDAFNQELMLRIMSEEDKVIDGSDLQWYSRSGLLENRSNFNFYITTDFATSEGKANDFSVISVWAYSNKGHWFWVDGVCKQQLMDKNVDDLFRLVQLYDPISVGVEVTGQQGGFIQWLQSEMVSRNIFFNFASEGNNGRAGVRPNKAKFERFMLIVPWFKQKLFFFPKECQNDKTMVECMDELGLVTVKGFKSKHDDFIDTISMLNVMNAYKPSQENGMRQEEGGVDWGYESDDYGYGRGSYIV